MRRHSDSATSGGSPIINPIRELNTGGRLNIKMSSYQYRDPHVEDKAVVIPRKDGLNIETGP